MLIAHGRAFVPWVLCGLCVPCESAKKWERGGIEGVRKAFRVGSGAHDENAEISQNNNEAEIERLVKRAHKFETFAGIRRAWSRSSFWASSRIHSTWQPSFLPASASNDDAANYDAHDYKRHDSLTNPRILAALLRSPPLDKPRIGTAQGIHHCLHPADRGG
jgi:hypothetical protein